MIPENIKKLISDTPRKKINTPELERLEKLVKPPPLTIYTIHVLILEEDSPLTMWIFDLRPMTEKHWKKVQPPIHAILAFIQTLGYIHCFHPKDIQLLFEAATKHFLGNTGVPFESKDLELTTVLNEHLKHPNIPQLIEPH